VKSLLEDLDSDLIADALGKPAAPRPNEWREPVRWEFGGYLARVRLIECPSCHQWDWVSEGVFAEERASNGTRRLTHAPHFPMGETGRRMETHVVMGDICFKCLSESMGFDNLIEAPEVITNVAGEGFSAPRPRTSLGFTRKGD
jgi:hypothetical protein